MGKISYTQKEMVLLHLSTGEPLTCLEALKRYGIYYLTRWIMILIREGVNIHKRWIKVRKANGQEVKVKEYWVNIPKGQLKLFEI